MVEKPEGAMYITAAQNCWGKECSARTKVAGWRGEFTRAKKRIQRDRVVCVEVWKKARSNGEGVRARARKEQGLVALGRRTSGEA